MSKALAELKAIHRLARVEGRPLTQEEQRRVAWLAWKIEVLRQIQNGNTR